MTAPNNPAVLHDTPHRIWIGYWLMAVAVLHTLYAGFRFGPVFAGIAQRGVINTVGRDPLTGTAVWFALFGAGMALIAMAIIPLERGQQHAALRPLGLGLLMLCALGIALMPASGFWLGLPAAIAMLQRR